MWPKLRLNVGLSHRQLRGKNSLAATIVVLVCGCMFALGIYVSRIVEREISKSVVRSLAILQTKSGVTVLIGSINTGFGKVTLNEVRIGREGWAVIDRIQVEVSLVPWRDFLRVTNVGIGQLVIKAPWRRELWPAEMTLLVDLISKRVLGQRKDGVTVSSTSSRYLPMAFYLNAGRIEFSDQKTTKILGENISLSGDFSQRQFHLRFDHLTALGRFDESFVEATLSMPRNEKPTLLLSSRPKSDVPPIWNANCAMDVSKKSVACDVDAQNLPSSLTAPLRSRLGADFSPGFRGNISVEPLAIDSLSKGVTLGVKGEFNKIQITNPALAVARVGPSKVQVSSVSHLDFEKKSINVEKSWIVLLAGQQMVREDDRGIPIEVEAAGSLDRKGDGSYVPSGVLRVKMKQIECGEAFRAIPGSFMPDLGKFELAGTASLVGAVTVAAGVPSIAIHSSTFNCIVMIAPELYSSAYLDSPFIIERESDVGPIHIPVDPGRPYFAAYTDIPELTRSAFVSSEDSGFYQHHGIEMSSIVGAAQKNSEAGRAVIGGSTITMQTVKNLYLSRDKTISRKAQEVFLAWHIERIVSKERILEVYLNMVEFGPGLYGLGQASQRFFGKTPQQLTLKESVYLASLLPAPVPRYRYFCEGKLTPNYEKIVKQLLDRMLSLGKITAAKHAVAAAERIHFSEIERESACGGMSVHLEKQDETAGLLEDVD